MSQLLGMIAVIVVGALTAHASPLTPSESVRATGSQDHHRSLHHRDTNSGLHGTPAEVRTDTNPPSIGPINPDYRYASPDAVEAWHDLKFGLRIHWGEYAIDALGPESWPLNRAHNITFLKWYWDQYKTWNPAKYDPNQWISMMNTAGIKFFDFTLKHHEGFSMFDTNTDVHDCWNLDGPNAAIEPCCSSGPDCRFPYSSQQAFGRDVAGELVAAARAGGVRPGFYFSHIDWFDPDMRIDEWNAVASAGKFCPTGSPCDPANYSNATSPVEWGRFVLRHRAQIVEALTKYGEVVELSLDMQFPPIFNQAMQDTIMLARSIAPNTLFRGRGIGGTKQEGGYGDYETPEETFPASPIPGNWQVIFHGSDYMSYDPDPSHYVNGSFIVWHLADIVAKGGLMQIGYGPDGNGQFHPKAVEALEYTGRWLGINGESIYGTRPLTQRWQDPTTSEIRYTQKNSSIYATYLDYGGDKFWGSPSHTLYCIDAADQKSTTVTLLGYIDDSTRQPIPLTWSAGQNGSVTITLPQRQDPDMLPPPGFVFKITGAKVRADC
eukprot:m.69359 g.69359  ORF g.69359 m.69359 type:complete len:549 (-) comp8577_c0_seq1:122-1768(-)